MNVAVIGLGRMGEAIAARAVNAGHAVFGFDINKEMCASAERAGVTIVSSLSRFVDHDITVFFIMVPQGELVDRVIQELQSVVKPGDLVIDGGNSKYSDSMRRAQALESNHIFFLDCGTSGGVHGREHGFCLMVGGKKEAYDKAFPFLSAIAIKNGCAHVGPSGAGHYVKMVHNGIEYGLLQAYAEGFYLLKDGLFKEECLDLEKIAALWNNGSVIRSWILDLVENVMKQDQELKDVLGIVAATGMGKWTVESAQELNISLPVIEKALEVRTWSQETGGDYATKIVAMLRNQFGGHSVVKK